MSYSGRYFAALLMSTKDFRRTLDSVTAQKSPLAGRDTSHSVLAIRIEIPMKSPRPKEWTDEEVRLLTRMARQNLTSSEIASALGRHVASVKRIGSSPLSAT